MMNTVQLILSVFYHANIPEDSTYITTKAEGEPHQILTKATSLFLCDTKN